MRSFSVLSSLLAVMLTLASCSGGSSGEDLFAESGKGGVPGQGGAPSGSSGRPVAVGGALSVDPPSAGRAGSASSGGASSGGATPSPSAGAAGAEDGAAGRTEAGSPSFGGSAPTAGSGAGGRGAGSGGAGFAGGGTSAAGGSAGGNSGGSPAGSAGSAGSVGGSGASGAAGSGQAGGSGDGAECAARRLELEDLLAAAQSCSRDAARVCSDTLEDECGCAVPVSNDRSDAAEAYAEAVALLRKDCPVACLAIQCPEARGAQCVAERGEERGRCTDRRIGPDRETE